MAKWVPFERHNGCPVWETPPDNWCLLTSSDDTNTTILARWSKSSFCWIGFNLYQIDLPKSENPLLYMETDYPTLTDMLYKPRPSK